MPKYFSENGIRQLGCQLARMTATGALLASAACNKPPPSAIPEPIAAPAPAPTPTVAVATPVAAPQVATPTTAAAAPNPIAAPLPTAVTAGPFLPSWYAPLFVENNEWTFLRKTVDVSPKTQRLQTRTRTTVCKVSHVVPRGSGVAASIACTGHEAGDYVALNGEYFANRRGLFQFNTATSEPPAGFAPLLRAPPRPESKETVGDPDAREGAFSSKARVRFVQRDVAGYGKVDVTEMSIADEDMGGTMTTLWHFAEGVGPVHYATSSSPSGQLETDELTLVQAKLAPSPPAAPPPVAVAGKLGFASAWPQMSAAKLPCVEALASLQFGGSVGTAGIFGREINRLPSGWSDIPTDIRPLQWGYRGKVAGKKCSMNLEMRGGIGNRLGTFWSGKPGDLAGMAAVMGPPAEHIALPQGSALDVWIWPDAVLTVYQPNVAKPDYEWWANDPIYWNENKESELKAWQAYAENDFAAAGDGKKPTLPVATIAASYKAAITLVPTYAKAGLRLCKLLAKNPPPEGPAAARQACGVALQSGFPQVRNEAAKLLTKIK